MNTKILTLFVINRPAQSFISPRLLQWRGSAPHLSAEADGGTDWIKDAMGGDGPNEPEFSQSEIADMENLIGKD